MNAKVFVSDILGTQYEPWIWDRFGSLLLVAALRTVHERPPAEPMT